MSDDTVLAALAAELERPAAELVPVTAPFGARYISTRAAVAVAGHAKVPGYRLAASVLAFSLAAGVINELGSERDDD